MPRRKISQVNSDQYKKLDVFWEKVEKIKSEIKKQQEVKENVLKEKLKKEINKQLEDLEPEGETNAILILKERIDQLVEREELRVIIPTLKKGFELESYSIADNEDLHIQDQIRKDFRKSDYEDENDFNMFE